MSDDEIPAGANRLSMLAAAIRDAHGRFQASTVEAAQAALDCGNWLNEAKASISRGGWIAWLETEVRMPPRTAQHYMRLASSGLDAQAVAHTGIAGAARALRKRVARRERDLDAFLEAQVKSIEGIIAKVRADAAAELADLEARGAVDAFAAAHPDAHALLLDQLRFGDEDVMARWCDALITAAGAMPAPAPEPAP